MEPGEAFEAKLQEHLQAVATLEEAAKQRVAAGIAGVRPVPKADSPVDAPVVARPMPSRSRAAVSFDEPIEPKSPAEGVAALDDEGIPVWEDPV